MKETTVERQKKARYEAELKKLILERKEQKKLDQLLMLSTLSPGGKIQWVDPSSPKGLSATDISNPFVEKSDIVNHKRKIHQIDARRERIQSMYREKQIKTWAQHEEEKKNQREYYFTAKQAEAEDLVEREKQLKADKRAAKWQKCAALNATLATERSYDKMA